MFAIHVESLGDLSIIECKGRIIRSDSVFRLRDVVREQTANTIALDLSEVEAIGGGGLARENNIHLKLYSPSKPVLEGLVQNRSIHNFEIVSFHEMMGILAQSDGHYDLAA